MKESFPHNNIVKYFKSVKNNKFQFKHCYLMHLLLKCYFIQDKNFFYIYKNCRVLIGKTHLGNKLNPLVSWHYWLSLTSVLLHYRMNTVVEYFLMLLFLFSLLLALWVNIWSIIRSSYHLESCCVYVFFGWAFLLVVLCTVVGDGLRRREQPRQRFYRPRGYEDNNNHNSQDRQASVLLCTAQNYNIVELICKLAHYLIITLRKTLQFMFSWDGTLNNSPIISCPWLVCQSLGSSSSCSTDVLL